MESYHYAIKLKAQSEKGVNWDTYVPEIAFVLFLCDATNEYVGTDKIASKAARTYPYSFSFMGGPNTYIAIMALEEATSTNWRYVRGDLIKGWKLTQKGLQFAKDVERRKLRKYKK